MKSTKIRKRKKIKNPFESGNKKPKPKPEMIGIGADSFCVNPHEVAAVMPELHMFKTDPEGNDLWRFVFLLKSGKEARTDYMGQTAFRAWKTKLQKMFDYIHPKMMDEWKVKHGFTGYLDGFKNQDIE